MKSKLLTAAALAGVLSFAITANATAAEPEKSTSEKCYGVVKTAQNDCGTSAHGCAGQATKDGDTSEWIMLPMGVCTKLVNGSLTAPAAAPAEVPAAAPTVAPDEKK